MKTTGKVKWFNEEKGLAFVETEDGEDLLIHHQEILQSGYRKLSDGQTVSFDLQQGSSGLTATNIELCGPHGSGGGDDE